MYNEKFRRGKWASLPSKIMSQCKKKTTSFIFFQQNVILRWNVAWTFFITSAGEAGVDMTGYTGTDGGSGVLGAVGNKSNSNQNCSKLQEWAGQRLTAETGEGIIAFDYHDLMMIIINRLVLNTYFNLVKHSSLPVISKQPLKEASQDWRTFENGNLPLNHINVAVWNEE